MMNECMTSRLSENKMYHSISEFAGKCGKVKKKWIKEMVQLRQKQLPMITFPRDCHIFSILHH